MSSTDVIAPKRPKPTRRRIQIAIIRLDGGTQMRADGLDEATVHEYVEAIERGETLPPVLAIYDGTDYWLVGGFHRVEAHVRAGKKVIEAEVLEGTLRDAQLLAVAENATHGLRRSNADKRAAVETLLTDPEWSQWSDREIARRCGVGYTLVATVRQELSARNGQMAEGTHGAETQSAPAKSSEARTVQRGGTTYTMRLPETTQASVEGKGDNGYHPADVAGDAETPLQSSDAQNPLLRQTGGLGNPDVPQPEATYPTVEPDMVAVTLPPGGRDDASAVNDDMVDDGDEDEEDEDEEDEDLAATITVDGALTLLRAALRRGRRGLRLNSEPEPGDVELVEDLASYLGVDITVGRATVEDDEYSDYCDDGYEEVESW